MQLGLHLLVKAEFRVEILIVVYHLQTVLHDGRKIDLGVADALGVLDIVIARLFQRDHPLHKLQIQDIELLILGVDQLVGKLQPVGVQHIPAVELVPHHIIEKGHGLFHQVQRIAFLVVDTGGQKTVLPVLHLRLFPAQLLFGDVLRVACLGLFPLLLLLGIPGISIQ